MLKIRRPLGRLIFNMGIAIPGRTVFLIETAPSIHLLSNTIWHYPAEEIRLKWADWFAYMHMLHCRTHTTEWQNLYTGIIVNKTTSLKVQNELLEHLPCHLWGYEQTISCVQDKVMMLSNENVHKDHVPNTSFVSKQKCAIFLPCMTIPESALYALLGFGVLTQLIFRYNNWETADLFCPSADHKLIF